MNPPSDNNNSFLNKPKKDIVELVGSGSVRRSPRFASSQASETQGTGVCDPVEGQLELANGASFVTNPPPRTVNKKPEESPIDTQKGKRTTGRTQETTSKPSSASGSIARSRNMPVSRVSGEDHTFQTLIDVPIGDIYSGSQANGKCR